MHCKLGIGLRTFRSLGQHDERGENFAVARWTTGLSAAHGGPGLVPCGQKANRRRRNGSSSARLQLDPGDQYNYFNLALFDRTDGRRRGLDQLLPRGPCKSTTTSSPAHHLLADNLAGLGTLGGSERSSCDTFCPSIPTTSTHARNSTQHCEWPAPLSLRIRGASGTFARPVNPRFPTRGGTG